MKIAVTAVIIMLVAVGFYLLSWSEKYKEIETLEAKYEERVKEKERLNNDLSKLEEYEQQVADLEQELMGLVQSQFTQEEPELFVANYIAEIERMVVSQQEATGDYDFKITQISPKAQEMSKVQTGDGDDDEEEMVSSYEESETLQGFPTRVFDMTMTGRYATLVDFLYELGALELDRLVTINQITLTPQNTESGDSPVLTVTIPITAYLRQGSK